MAEIDNTLSKYLSHAMVKKWRWGEFDCMLWVADWVKFCTGQEIAAEYRNNYTTEREARNRIKEAGGIIELMELCVSRAGAKRTTDPQPGDFGLVRVPFKQWRGRWVQVPAGALHVRDDMWAIKPADGQQLIIHPFPVVAAWTLKDG